MIVKSYIWPAGAEAWPRDPRPAGDGRTGREEWNAYVRQAKQAHYSHLWEWGGTLARIYRLPLLRLASRQEENGPLNGVLPLILFAPAKGEKRLISLPYTDAAGVAADDAQTAGALLGAALQCLQETQASHLELRQDGAELYLPDAALELTSTAHTFKTGLVRELPESKEELWASLGPKVRNQVRKALKQGCAATLGGAGLVEEFFGVFSENMRDLGSPVHDPELFRAMAREMPGALALISCAGLPAAAAMLFMHGKVMYNPWASSLRRYRPLCPNMLLYWSMLAYAIERGCRWFDFGRSSPDSSACRFKEQWGAMRRPLTWQVISIPGRTWDPRNENLESREIMGLKLEASRKQGPGLRRWISL